MAKNKVKATVTRFLEKIYTIDRATRATLNGGDTPTLAQIATWAGNVSNIPLGNRNGAIIRLESDGSDVWDGYAPDFSQVFWVIDNGAGVTVTEITNYDLLTAGFTDLKNRTAALETDNVGAIGGTFKTRFINSGSGAITAAFGEHIVVTDPSTSTSILLDMTYSNMKGHAFMIQNYKSSGNLTITLGSHTLLNSVSAVIAAGASLHLVAVATAVSPTDYQFSKVN